MNVRTQVVQVRLGPSLHTYLTDRQHKGIIQPQQQHTNQRNHTGNSPGHLITYVRFITYF